MNSVPDSSSTSVTFCAYDRPGGGGGPLAWAEDFIAFLSTQYRTRVLILCPGGLRHSGLARFCNAIDVSISLLDTETAPWMEDQVEWILREWRKHPSQTFIANLVVPGYYAGRWIRNAGGRTIGVMHSNPDFDPFHTDLLARFTKAPSFRPDAFVAVSDFIARRLTAVAPPSLRVATIPCGTRSSPKTAAPPYGELRLLYCGRLVEKAKRIRELTEALINATQLEGVTATLCGDGEERNWVEERIASEPKVRYVGAVAADRVQELMLEHHVIVLLSEFEGMPMAIVEGMECGLVPVCLYEPSGTAELIESGRNGIVVPDRGESFVNAINSLREVSVWSRLSSEARRTAEQRYIHEVAFSSWRQLIDEISAGATPRIDRIPRRVNLRKAHTPDSFPGYPRARPLRRTQVTHFLKRAWTQFRQAVRPRARVRELASRRRAP